MPLGGAHRWEAAPAHGEVAEFGDHRENRASRLSPRLRRSLERALQWSAGSVDQALASQDATVVEPVAEPETTQSCPFLVVAALARGGEAATPAPVVRTCLHGRLLVSRHEEFL